MKDNKRKNKLLIINEILDQVDKKELTVNEIADNIGSHWLTVRDTINFLSSHGLVEVKTYGTEKRYKIAQGIKRSDLTYYQIPIDDKTQNLALYIFNKIKERWLEVKEGMINKTFLQKIAVDVIEKLELDVPCGWYKFGKITIFNIDPNINYSHVSKPSNYEEIDKQVGKSVDLFKKFKYTWEVRKHQYKEHNKIQYLINENLRLISNNMIDLSTPNNRKALPAQLDKLKNLIPDNEYTKEIKRVLLEFISTLNSYLSNDDFDINNIKSIMYDAYESIWDLIATYNFCDSLSEYSTYDKETLKSYFMIFINEKIISANDRVTELEMVS